MDKPKIRIEVYDDERSTAKLWINGDEVHDVTQIEFFAGAGGSKNMVRCCYWKNARTESGKILVLNNTIVAEKVIVSD